MKDYVEFWGDSLFTGVPGVPLFPLLMKKNPDLRLINRGHTGDTLKSLYRRLKRDKQEKYALAVLWIGTNDILVHAGPTIPFFKTILRQPWTKTEKEFFTYYRKCLDLLTRKAERVVTLPPVLVGEEVESGLNRRISSLGDIIQSISSEYKTVYFGDLREPVYEILREGKSSDFITRSSLGFVRDALFIRKTDSINRHSLKRGLRLTLDGVHWNTRGAGMVTDFISSLIHRAFE